MLRFSVVLFCGLYSSAWIALHRDVLPGLCVIPYNLHTVRIKIEDRKCCIL